MLSCTINLAHEGKKKKVVFQAFHLREIPQNNIKLIFCTQKNPQAQDLMKNYVLTKDVIWNTIY